MVQYARTGGGSASALVDVASSSRIAPVQVGRAIRVAEAALRDSIRDAGDNRPMKDTDRIRPPRLTLRAFFQDAADELLSADRGLPYTFLNLFRAPAAVVREYIDWRSARVTKPLRYLLIVVLLTNLASAMAGWIVAAADAGVAPTNSAVATDARPATNAERTAVVVSATVLRLANDHADGVLLFAVPFLALAFRRTYGNQDYNFAEFWVLALYGTAQAYGVVVLAGVALKLGTPLPDTVALTLAPPTIAWICADVVPGSRWRNFAIGLASFALAFVLLSLLLIAALFITLAVGGR